MSKKDVQPVPIPASDAGTAFLAGRVPVAVTYEPYLTTALQKDNNAKLIASLDGVPPERRGARYRCVAVLVTPEGDEIAGVGSCEGRIGFEARGTGGFGYDPWFIPERESRTMAELTAEEKHAISHRGKALRGLAEKLRHLANGPAGGSEKGGR